MLHDYNFNSTAKPFSILLGLLLSASTRLFVSDVLQISTLLPLLIKYVSSAVRGISTGTYFTTITLLLLDTYYLFDFYLDIAGSLWCFWKRKTSIYFFYN
ncbi:hypothetical protein HanHA300_Chr02g0049651 [Helianthus annuus]|nr:hypothetical protein HanHA300_Chr02g0049651 [Helianthus annuus]